MRQSFCGRCKRSYRGDAANMCSGCQRDQRAKMAVAKAFDRTYGPAEDARIEAAAASVLAPESAPPTAVIDLSANAADDFFLPVPTGPECFNGIHIGSCRNAPAAPLPFRLGDRVNFTNLKATYWVESFEQDPIGWMVAALYVNGSGKLQRAWFDAERFVTCMVHE